jgi:hypothetical protein
MTGRTQVWMLAALMHAAVLCAAASAQTPPSEGMTMTMPMPMTQPATQPAPQTAPAGAPRVSLESTTEEGQKILHAAVSVDGKPVPNVTVAFYVRRSFGNMQLGQDQTEEDGTAAVPFPADLPGLPAGQLQVIAVVTAPPQYTSGRAEATFAGAPVVSLRTDEFPRALWAPQAPLMLILVILSILAAVWLAYGYVAFQLLRISHRR